MEAANDDQLARADFAAGDAPWLTRSARRVYPVECSDHDGCGLIDPFTTLLTEPRGTMFAGPGGTPGLAWPYEVRRRILSRRTSLSETSGSSNPIQRADLFEQLAQQTSKLSGARWSDSYSEEAWQQLDTSVFGPSGIV